MNGKVSKVIQIILIAGIIIFITLLNKASSDIKIIVDIKDFNKIYFSNHPKVLLIDLREEDDYEKIHLDKFVNIPYSLGMDRFLEFLEDNNYNEKTVVLMCYTGKKSGKRFNDMYAKGYRNIYLVNMKCDEILNATPNYISTGPCNCLE